MSNHMTALNLLFSKLVTAALACLDDIVDVQNLLLALQHIWQHTEDDRQIQAMMEDRLRTGLDGSDSWWSWRLLPQAWYPRRRLSADGRLQLISLYLQSEALTEYIRPKVGKNWASRPYYYLHIEIRRLSTS